jgi:hypothetical protein
MTLPGKTAAGLAIFGALCAATAAEARPGWYRPAWQQPDYRVVTHAPPYGRFYRERGVYAEPHFSPGDVAGIQAFERMR